MHQHTPEEWAQMTVDARIKYRRLKIPMGPVRGTLLGVYGLFVLSVNEWGRYLAEWNRTGVRPNARM